MTAPDLGSDPVRDLFERARSLVGEAQTSFLDQSCVDDESLRREVEALLAADARAGSGTPDSRTMPGGRPASELTVGDQLGPYRLLELLGEGGFGSVYLAEQRQPIRRRVALKVIKLGMDTRQVIARFEAERQALALMTHSNIARVLDVGATDSGRPYFVMELVSGVPITDYCERQRLGLDERLQLFVSVCNALQHAHQKGVIHRDVKPSNILVGEESGRAVPKVIDFGIAKATLQDLTDKTLVTLQHQLIGTPAYMPPEQAEQAGLDVDTRSDIYALGVLLYELLTGVTPFDSRTLLGVGRTEMLRIIREVEPRRPSARVAADDGDREVRRRPPGSDLARRLQGDLDWIVMKCLEKDRSRRYETASELAAEVLRHLGDEPVLAGAPSTAYRLRKFARRNRAGVLAGSIGLALLLVAVVGTTWGWLWALEERARADALVESEKGARLEAQESALMAGLAADEAAAASRRAEQEAAEARVARAASSRRAEELQQVMGLQEATLRDLDSEELGLHLRDGFLAQAAETAERTGLSPEELAEDVASLEARLTGFSFTDLALGTIIEGVLDPTLAAVREQFRDQVLVRARMEQTLASLYHAQGLYERAVPPQRSALDTRRAELGAEHPETLESLAALGHLLHDQGHPDQALEIFEACLRSRLSILGPEHRDTLTSVSSMGSVLRSLGRLEEAREHHERVLEQRRRLFGEGDEDSLVSLAELGATLYDMKEWEEAKLIEQEVLAGRRALLGDRHLETLASINNLGTLLRDMRFFDEALPLLREGYASSRSQYGERHFSTLSASGNLGGLLRQMGELNEAQNHLEEVLSVRRTLYGELHPHTLASSSNLGMLRYDQGRHEEADRLLRRAWLGSRRIQGEAHPQTLDYAALLGAIRTRNGHLVEAEHPLVENALVARRELDAGHQRTERALADVEVLLRGLHQEYATLSGPSDEMLAVLNAVASASSSVGRFDESEAILRAGLTVHEGTEAGVSPWLLAESRSLLGEAAAGQRRLDEAEVLLLEGFQELDRQRPNGGDPGRLIRSGRRLARFYEDGRRPESAAIWWERVRALEATDG